jgi:hypothetical protein
MPEHAAAKLRNLLLLCSFVSFVVMVFSLFGCSFGAAKHPNWNSATGAEQHERLMWKAIRQKDWKEVEHRLAPTFTGVNAKGQTFDRAGWVEYWKNSPVSEFSLGDVAVHPNGPDMTVTYLLQLSGGGSTGLRVVSVWQQVKSGWILTATTHTPIQGT